MPSSHSIPSSTVAGATSIVVDIFGPTGINWEGEAAYDVKDSPILQYMREEAERKTLERQKRQKAKLLKDKAEREKREKIEKEMRDKAAALKLKKGKIPAVEAKVSEVGRKGKDERGKVGIENVAGGGKAIDKKDVEKEKSKEKAKEKLREKSGKNKSKQISGSSSSSSSSSSSGGGSSINSSVADSGDKPKITIMKRQTPASTPSILPVNTSLASGPTKGAESQGGGKSSRKDKGKFSRGEDNGEKGRTTKPPSARPNRSNPPRPPPPPPPPPPVSK